MIFNLQQVQRATGVKMTGVIHVGAFLGEELSDYRSLGLDNTILFEPQKKLYDMVKFKCWPTEKPFNVALGSEEQEAEMFISDRKGGWRHGAGASSSILEPKDHLKLHPEVTFFPDKQTISVKRFDEFVKEEGLDISNHNLLNIDVQGYELEVLKGVGDYLNQIELIIAEVNRTEVYKDCALIEDIDAYVSKFGFKRFYVEWSTPGWGDAIYAKEETSD
tara:strand:+ start:652 stop:1308 length:657 start_codon:yes stop_codon:yes gene_type:complete